MTPRHILSSGSAIALAAIAVASPAAAANKPAGPVHAIATFHQAPTKKGGAPAKSLLYKNEDVVKTTTTTTKTPVYATVTVPVYTTVKTPVYDAKGKLTGYTSTKVQTGTTTQQKLTGYNVVTTKSTAVTPRTRLYTTDGSSTAAATPVVFDYTHAPAGSFAAALTGDQNALFSLSTTSTSAPVLSNGVFTQAFGPGSLSFIRTTPLTGAGGTPLSNLLTVGFDSLTLTARAGGTQYWLTAKTPENGIGYTSDFLRFTFPGQDSAFEFSLLGWGGSGFAIAALDPALTNVTGARTLNTFRSNAQGVLSASAVPEPATWALMILGFGMVGGALRRRRGMVVRTA